MATLNICNSSGHKTISYSPVEFKKAKEAFDSLSGSGYVGFRKSDREQIREFDPHADEISMVPQLAGGC